MKEDIKEFIMDTKDTAKRVTSRVSKEANTHVTPFHLCLSIFMLLCIQMCTDTPTVRIVLENNGSPVVIKQVKTIKVIHKEPVITKTSVKAILVADSKFQIGDCLADESIAKDLKENQTLEEWEKNTISYDKVINVGKIKYQYLSWYSDDWSTTKHSYSRENLDSIRVKVKCPDVS